VEREIIFLQNFLKLHNKFAPPGQTPFFHPKINYFFISFISKKLFKIFLLVFYFTDQSAMQVMQVAVYDIGSFDRLAVRRFLQVNILTDLFYLILFNFDLFFNLFYFILFRTFHLPSLCT
jgi:hypothetical protein